MLRSWSSNTFSGSLETDTEPDAKYGRCSSRIGVFCRLGDGAHSMVKLSATSLPVETSSESLQCGLFRCRQINISPIML